MNLQVTETATEITTTLTTEPNNSESLEISTLSSREEDSEEEDIDIHVKNTTMQAQSNSVVKTKNEDSNNDTDAEVNVTAFVEAIPNESQVSKNVKYNSTEVESSLSDEIVMVLEEKTGWICNGTSCTDHGPIYNRQKPSDGNIHIFFCHWTFVFMSTFFPDVKHQLKFLTFQTTFCAK